MRHANKRIEQVVYLSFLFFITINLVASFLIIPEFGFSSADNATWSMAAGQVLPQVGYRSPLPILITQVWQFLFGTGEVSANLFHTSLFVGAIILLYISAISFFKEAKIGLFCVWITASSPYLLWSVYVGRDVVHDVFAFSIFLFFTVRVFNHPNKQWTWIGFAFFGAVMVMMREQNLAVFILVALALGGVICRMRFRQVALIFGLFALFLSPLLLYNFLGSGKISLSSRVGDNLYYGNHPAYLLGHPTFDIDVFLSQTKRQHLQSEDINLLSQAEQDEYLRNWAWNRVKQDPAGFAYRSLLKGIWWLGAHRIPATDASAYLNPDSNQIVVTSTGNAGKDLAYLLHRIFVLGLVVYLFIKNSVHWHRLLILILPTLSLLPIVMLTFPDTRFRLSYDLAIYILAGAGLFEALKETRRTI